MTDNNKKYFLNIDREKFYYKIPERMIDLQIKKNHLSKIEELLLKLIMFKKR